MPPRVRVAASRDHFERDDKPFFYLADTAWSAFTNATEAEWDEYLAFRAAQGFSVLQLNVLPQWDRSVPDLGIAPFDTFSDGRYDFGKPNEAYFARAERLLDAAVTRGFVPALVVLWADYVPGTWLSAAFPEHVMPLARVERFAASVAERFRRHGPIYLISGDTNFPYEDTSRHYLAALDAVKAVDPEALTSLHPMGLVVEPPEIFAASPRIDFSMYQSGHHRHEQRFCYEYAERLLRQRVRRPIVNGEPCYEGIAIDAPKIGRDKPAFGPPITQAEVRRSIWWSLLSGAKAGVGTSAHGVWCWHDRHRKNPASDPTVRTPYDSIEPRPWREAMRLGSADDAAYAARLFRDHALYELSPDPDAFRERPPGAFLMSAAERTRFAIYLPEGGACVVAGNRTRLRWSEYDLPQRKLVGEVEVERVDGGTRLRAASREALLVGTAV